MLISVSKAKCQEKTAILMKAILFQKRKLSDMAVCSQDYSVEGVTEMDLCSFQ